MHRLPLTILATRTGHTEVRRNLVEKITAYERDSAERSNKNFDESQFRLDLDCENEVVDPLESAVQSFRDGNPQELFFLLHGRTEKIVILRYENGPS